MDECKGGDLFDKIVDGGIKLNEQRASEVVGSLLDAIAYLHDRDIVHRDLKVSRSGHLVLNCVLRTYTSDAHVILITSVCCIMTIIRRNTLCYRTMTSTPL